MTPSPVINPNFVLKVVKENLRLRKLVETDPLTGLPNRAGFMGRAKDFLSQALRYKHPICIAMLDLDHFKKINDTYGHPIGDLVLKKASKILNNSLRRNDLVARYGGEEFIILLDLTPTGEDKNKALTTQERALISLERTRKSIAEMKINTPKGEISITISIGFAIYDPRDSSSRSTNLGRLLVKLIETADNNLYQAKNSGRNRIYPL